MWYCDVVVMALDVQSRGVKFDSELFQFHVLMLDILFTHMAVTWPWLRGFGADQRTVCSSCCCSLAYVPKSLERHLCQWDRLWLLEDRAGQDRYPWNERILVQEQKKTPKRSRFRRQSPCLSVSGRVKSITMWPNAFTESLVHHKEAAFVDHRVMFCGWKGHCVPREK